MGRAAVQWSAEQGLFEFLFCQLRPSWGYLDSLRLSFLLCNITIDCNRHQLFLSPCHPLPAPCIATSFRTLSVQHSPGQEIQTGLLITIPAPPPLLKDSQRPSQTNHSALTSGNSDWSKEWACDPSQANQNPWDLISGYWERAALSYGVPDGVMQACSCQRL